MLLFPHPCENAMMMTEVMFSARNITDGNSIPDGKTGENHYEENAGVPARPADGWHDGRCFRRSTMIHQDGDPDFDAMTIEQWEQYEVPCPKPSHPSTFSCYYIFAP